MEILIVSGLFVGFIAGFFGVGGGTVLVPILMLMGYSIQEAVGMAVTQMFISSAVGSFLNFKSKKLDIKILSFLGMGGLIGGSLSPYVVLHTSSTFLESLFFVFILLALVKFFYTPHGGKAVYKESKALYTVVGFMIALPSSSIGLGGAILLTPFLHAFMGYELKKATAASLFFVFFAAFAGTVSWAFTGELLYKEGLILGMSSILGVWLGLFSSHRTKEKVLKSCLLILYIVIFAYITHKLFFS